MQHKNHQHFIYLIFNHLFGNDFRHDECEPQDVQSKDDTGMAQPYRPLHEVSQAQQCYFGLHKNYQRYNGIECLLPGS